MFRRSLWHRMGIKTLLSEEQHITKYPKFWYNIHRYKSMEVKSNEEFEKLVLKNSKPVVVDFYADWCEPCKILTPKLQEVLKNVDTIDFATVEVSKNYLDAVDKYEIKSLPSVCIFENGRVVGRYVGLNEFESIDCTIQNLKKKYENGSTNNSN